MHFRPGKISAIVDAGDGKHSRISVTHGKQKTDKTTGELVGYHRHTSDVHVPTADAKSYQVGQRVHTGLEPANDAAKDPEPDEFDDQPDPTEAESIPGKQIQRGVPDKAMGKAKGHLERAMNARKGR